MSGQAKLRFICLLGLPLWLAGGCLPWASLLPYMSGSINQVTNGLLIHGGTLPPVGENFRVYNQRNRRAGVPPLIELVQNVSTRVASDHPRSRLLVGDLSAPGGGRISDHRSHRTGRDVDFAFFATDPAGREIPGYPLVAFDRFGVGVREGRTVVFDDQRNWRVVEALLTDETASVQWIFISNGLKARLLHWALSHQRNLETIRRAASVLRQPTDSSPHDDHFHVRIYCPSTAGVSHCVDGPPFWPWVERRRDGEPELTDEQYTELAIGGW